jgi:hypothetical protein
LSAENRKINSRSLGGAEDLAGALAARAAIAAIPGEGGAEAALLEPILTTAASLPSPCIPGTASSLNGRFLIKSNSYKNTSESNRYVSKGFCFTAQNDQK